ncbi:hypothetical protein [Armatimonas sp.]|uniref:hypothetical protein n=1 Tax=Armatimonas sp. TaxID=1872638 RepID=UPI003753B3CE
MPLVTIEERLTEVEKKLASLLGQTVREPEHKIMPWWESISGTFANSPDYDEAMRLGKAYRESLRHVEQEESPPGK